MASNIVPDTIDDAYPVAGQDNDSQGFRDNFNIIKTNFTYAKSEIETLQSDTAKKTEDNIFFENTLSRYVTKQGSMLHENVSNTGDDFEISLTNAHHFTISNSANRTLTLVDWSAFDADDTDGEYQEMILYLKSDTGDAWDITLASKNASGTATADYYVDASFGGARVITMAADDTTIKVVKAYTYDKGVQVFFEFLGTFTRIA
jgi:hypothetical protein